MPNSLLDHIEISDDELKPGAFLSGGLHRERAETVTLYSPADQSPTVSAAIERLALHTRSLRSPLSPVEVYEHQGALVLSAADPSGKTLSNLLGRGALALPEALAFGEALVEALASLSELGLLHLTLRPDVIWVAPQLQGAQGERQRPRISLGELPVCVALSAALSVTEQAADVWSQTSAATGTGAVDIEALRFSSPEQLQELENYTVYTPLYRAGCVLYALLAGAPPFGDETLYALMQSHLTRPPAPLALPTSVASPAALAQLNALLAAMLAKTPQERPTLLEALSALKSIAALVAQEAQDRAARLVQGRYELVDEIGRGGFGVVYRALDLNVARREVAVKQLTLDARAHPQVVELFEREAKVLSRLRHPNTLTIIDYGLTERGEPFMVSELLVGKPLNRFIQDQPDGRLPLLLTLKAMRGVAEALEEAHALGVVHRDIKPENVFVLEQVHQRGVGVKLLDFGIAKIKETAQSTLIGGAQTQGPMGTPFYMSPEQLDHAGLVDYRADFYSLGIMTYECLTGEPPFRGASFFALISQHKEAPLPRVSCHEDTTLNEEINALLAWLTAKSREARPASADVVIQELDALITEVAQREPKSKMARVSLAQRSVSLTAAEGAPQMLTSAPAEPHSEAPALSRSEPPAPERAPKRKNLFPLLLLMGAALVLVSVYGLKRVLRAPPAPLQGPVVLQPLTSPQPAAPQPTLQPAPQLAPQPAARGSLPSAPSPATPPAALSAAPHAAPTAAPQPSPPAKPSGLKPVSAVKLRLSGLIHKPGGRVRLSATTTPAGAPVTYVLSPRDLGKVKGNTLYLGGSPQPNATIQACSGGVCSAPTRIRVTAATEEPPE